MNEKKYKYSHEQWTEITHADCVETARALGLEFDERRSDHTAIRVKDHGGLFVWRDGKGWFQHSTDEKGKAVDLVMKEQGCTYRQAMDFIANTVLHNVAFESDRSTRRQEIEKIEKEKTYEKGEFVLPKASSSAKQTFAYLIKTRCIERDIVRQVFEQRIVFQTEKYINCCFASYDKNNVPRYAALRGVFLNAEQPFKGEVKNSDKRFGWKMMSEQSLSRKLYVFEAAIDAMSHASLYLISGRWKGQNEGTRLALGGVSLLALHHHLEEYPDKYDEIIVCTDNDGKGNYCEQRIREEFSDKFQISRKVSKLKDWNEDLQMIAHIAQENNISRKSALQIFYKSDEELPKMTEEAEEIDEIEL